MGNSPQELCLYDKRYACESLVENWWGIQKPFFLVRMDIKKKTQAESGLRMG